MVSNLIVIGNALFRVKSKIFFNFPTSFFLLSILLLFSFNISKAYSHDSDGKMIEADPPFPKIEFEIKDNSPLIYTLTFKFQNFNLPPVEGDLKGLSNSGHILLSINNDKKIIINKSSYDLSKNLLKIGKNELFVMLLNSDHYLYTKMGAIIYKAKILYKE